MDDYLDGGLVLGFESAWGWFDDESVASWCFELDDGDGNFKGEGLVGSVGDGEFWWEMFVGSVVE